MIDAEVDVDIGHKKAQSNRTKGGRSFENEVTRVMDTAVGKYGWYLRQQEVFACKVRNGTDDIKVDIVLRDNKGKSRLFIHCKVSCRERWKQADRDGRLLKDQHGCESILVLGGLARNEGPLFCQKIHGRSDLSAVFCFSSEKDRHRFKNALRQMAEREEVNAFAPSLF
jgi:hypothetical protein